MMRAFCKILTATILLLATLPAGAVVLQGDPLQSLGHFGDAASELEDLNGDGRWEFLVGAPLVDLTGTNDGRVYLWYGGTAMTAAANLVLSGNFNEQFGFSVARVGDVNDDGRPDFAVGAPRYSQAGTDWGRVYLFFGGPALDATADVILECPDATDGPQFGFSVSAAGDVNGDGRDDFIVGAPYDDTVGRDAGSAYVFYGSSQSDAARHGRSCPPGRGRLRPLRLVGHRRRQFFPGRARLRGGRRAGQLRFHPPRDGPGVSRLGHGRAGSRRGGRPDA